MSQVIARRIVKPYVFSEFPKMVWDPETEESRVAKGPGDVPAGWLDCHPRDPKRPAAVKTFAAVADGDGGRDAPASTPPDRTAVIDALRARGVAFNPRASTEQLTAMLSGRPQ